MSAHKEIFPGVVSHGARAEQVLRKAIDDIALGLREQPDGAHDEYWSADDAFSYAVADAVKHVLRLELRADERPFAAAYAAAKVELAAFCSRDRCDGPTWGTCYAMVCAWAEMAVLSGMAIRGEPKGDYEAIVSQAIDAILKDVAVHAVGPDSFILCDAEWAYEEYGS